MSIELTLPYFEERLRALGSALARHDPEGVDYALRLGVAQALFLFHDELRSQEQPFDRRAFAARLGAAVDLVDRAPAIAAGTGNRPDRRAPYEEYVADLYSRCWAKFDDQAFLGTVEYFEERFRLNAAGLEGLRDGECLDAGCGSGRYTIAMVRAGGRHAIGVDLSDRAIREARARAARLGDGDRTEFVCGSVVELPEAWTSRFDFVCSNGVVHHTPSPAKGLAEIARVLKPGGTAFIMVYGTGGLFWALVDFVRDALTPVPLDVADAWLELTGTPIGKVFFCLDHWYTPYQERITRDELERRLRHVGLTDLRYLPRARIYDSSERLYRYPEEADLVGTPDLRYLARKPA